ncbi:lysine--tRNA ligase [Agrococcus jejuensis]|uniref:Lysine--tRNA ligase n=1 Tax=Agrococcus jejuensis TaxID=399736 RepID=A0A1G8C0M8_9MICO|nr:lysine--tRNA ligase [Agrococcus jejuensis]SDH38924.1 lysyl-tRNA synthetase, class I [Agrococcus jejuensis]
MSEPTPNAADVRDDWVSRLADEVIEKAARLGTTPIVASGLSPSGVIHLGNFREVMSPHLVGDEIRRRGLEVEHIISWDDYDRFRKVPAGIEGVDESWAQHIGKPLTSVPAPPGSPHDSWAAHFRTQAEEGFAALGIRYRGISQTEQYTSGAYTEQILDAMRKRREIDAILAQFRTLPAAKDEDEELQKALDAGSGAASEDDGSGGAEYYPYKPYCTACGTDLTTITAYDDDSTELSYTCQCGHVETVLLREHRSGKLVWKVDWPMRWAYERVVFEPSGVDHQSPGSSFQVGLELAPLFGWERPYGPMYAFVGFGGAAKMSSSRGGAPAPIDALQVMEGPVLRWQYARRRMNQSFDVAFGSELQRLYDEWDALGRKLDAGTAGAAEIAAHARAIGTADETLESTPHRVAFRTLASLVDLSTGDSEQLVRLVRQVDATIGDLGTLQPRLGRVETWVATQMPADERTVVRAAPDADTLDALEPGQRAAIGLLLDGGGGLPAIGDAWSIDGLTNQVYGVVKVQRGLEPTAIVKGDKEIAAEQRAFFTLLYRLLVDRDAGPRLPTLLLAIGEERLRALLGA